jgi:hypothetical protein
MIEAGLWKSRTRKLDRVRSVNRCHGTPPSTIGGKGGDQCAIGRGSLTRPPIGVGAGRGVGCDGAEHWACLVKQLCLAKISKRAAANAFLKDEYWSEWNQSFAPPIQEFANQHHLERPRFSVLSSNE